MEQIESILVALDGKSDPRPVIAKAVAVAGRTGARLAIFLCDAERGYIQRQQFDARGTALARDACIGESLHQLRELWRSIGNPELAATFDAAWDSPLYEGIVRRARRAQVDLVIRGIGTVGAGERATLDANDWELVRTCPVPLLLTRGKSWSAQPAFAAAIDISGEEARTLTRAVLGTAHRFASICGGSLDVLHATGLDESSQETAQARRAALAQCVRDAQAEARELHLVLGDPASAMPAFASRRRYDLIVLGALTHRKALTALVGTLTGRLIEALECDFLLVKSPSYRSPVP